MLSENRCLACELPCWSDQLCEICFGDVRWQGEIPGSPAGTLAIAASEHLGLARDWVHRLKYRAEIRPGKALGALLAQMVQDEYAQRRERLPEAIVPVPLHWRRHLYRGRNQATVIAGPVARQLERPVWQRVLRRVRPTPSQRTLARSRRLENLQGCFQANAAALAGVQHLALLDDVYTTGATMSAAAAALHAAGVRRVDLWCATYTPQSHRSRPP
ncbi:MAG: hypothetical protein AAGG11_07590 [Pseudomonadota bacterium]